MGLLGEVTDAEVTEAFKKPDQALIEDNDPYEFYIKNVVKKEGPKGTYFDCELKFTNKEGKTVTVFHKVSLSKGARNMTIKFLKHVGLDPNAFEDGEQLTGLVGRAVLKVDTYNDKKKNEIRYLKD